MKIFVSLFIAVMICMEAGAADKPQLWLYCPTNLAVDQNVEKLRDLCKRAAAVGYDHVLLADSKMAKLGDLGDMSKRYFANIEKPNRSRRRCIWNWCRRCFTSVTPTACSGTTRTSRKGCR